MRDFFHVSFLVCFSYFLLIQGYQAILLFYSWIEYRLRTRQERSENTHLFRRSDLTIPISVIVPAYNEQAVIRDTVLAALRSDYPLFEVIVANDGSTDDTLGVLKKEFQLERATIFPKVGVPSQKVRAVFRSKSHPSLVVIDKVNGGNHADAANAALNFSRYRYVLTLDADTILEPDALMRAVRLALRNPREVVAVGSLIGLYNGFSIRDGRIRERRVSGNLLANLQVIEYLRAFLVNRLGWSRGNFNMCVSGAFGLWRRDVLVEMGGFQKGFSCDDLEMTYRVHEHFRKKKLAYRILSLPDPVCWTEAPTRTYSLYLQRHRWQRVQNECAAHYWRILFNPTYGSVGFLGAPYMLVAEVLGPWIELFSYVLIPLGWLLGELSFEQLGMFLLCSAGLNLLLSIAAIALFDRHHPVYRVRDVLRLVVAASVEFLVYRQTLTVARFMGTLAGFAGVRAWNKFEREPIRS
jgi:cellulose synthase/poly-beta-1,6-N-acetylglucosamine synthase-like glycosyltransferase